MSSFSRIACGFLVCASFCVSAFAAASETPMIQSVYKIKTYALESIGGNYSFSHWGSAVLIDKNRIITNAHVVLDINGVDPTGLYEICRSSDGKGTPDCFTTAKLVSYDTVSDLAILELANPVTTKPVTLSKNKISIGSGVVAYGYPAIGGSSITRTEGKIGGMDGDIYKFDGTIDSGNSGGGAFDSKGQLIGIPYAVKSDNGMIGYIIPTAIVSDFMAGKTDNIEKYSAKVPAQFTTYIKNIQSVGKNKDLIKTKYVEIKGLGKAGFELAIANESADGSIFDYRFLDKNKRVVISISCSIDATQKRSSIEFVQSMLNWKQDPKYVTTSKFLDKTETMLLFSTTPKQATNGEKAIQSGIMFKDAPNCAVNIFATDSVKKDKTSYEKALSIAQTVKFTNQKKYGSSFTSKFFNVESVTGGAYVSEGTSVVDINILPTIGFFLNTEIGTHSRLEIMNFEKITDYMNIGYDEDDYYTGNDETYKTFVDRYTVTNSSYIDEQILDSKDGKKIFATIIDRSESSDKPETRIIILYPFQTNAGEYKAYKFVFDYPATSDAYEKTILDIFKFYMTLPGKSPFKVNKK